MIHLFSEKNKQNTFFQKTTGKVKLWTIAMHTEFVILFIDSNDYEGQYF
jgi:hypothetical protein